MLLPFVTRSNEWFYRILFPNWEITLFPVFAEGSSVNVAVVNGGGTTDESNDNRPPTTSDPPVVTLEQQSPSDDENPRKK